MSTAAPVRVGIVPHLFRRQAVDLARRVLADIEALGYEGCVPESDAGVVGLQQWARPDDRFGEGLTYALSLGGDGTMLRTVELVSRFDVPILGVNVGHLGYLTALNPDDSDDLVGRLLRGAYEIDDRMLLSVTITQPDGERQDLLALNEAVLEKSSAGHTVRLSVAFNGEEFITYTADGLIVSTPTGSTAYAFSARGPIVSPRLSGIVVVPVSPHMLFDRSLVLHPSESVGIRVLDGRPASMFIDGRSIGRLSTGTVVECRASEHRARLVTFGPRHFHRILKAKFGLPGSATDEQTET